jgi:hypothetical protein
MVQPPMTVIIGRLAGPAVQARREYHQRLKHGPEWLAWEHWMTDVGRKEHDRRGWLDWWEKTRDMARDLEVDPPEVPLVPDFFRGGAFHTPEELMAEIRDTFGLPKGAQIQVELSASSREEAYKFFEKT